MKRISVRACRLELPRRASDLPAVLIVGNTYPYMLYKNQDGLVGLIDLLDGTIDEDMLLFKTSVEAAEWLESQFPNSTIEVVKEMMLTV